MARLGVEKIKTFAIGFEDQKFNELPYARQIAEHLSTEHHEMVVRPDAVAILPQLVRHFGEPMADNSAIPTYYVSQFARSEVTVALTGDGGDEVFAGYRRFYHATLTDRLERRRLLPLWRGLRRLTWNLESRLRPGKKRSPFPASRADEILSMKGVERYQHLLAYYPEAEKEELLTPAFREQSGQSATGYLAAHLARAVGADPLNRYLHLDLSTYLPEDILFKVDIASMLNSLECRSPFLDHKLIEFVFSLPGSYKLKFPHRHKHLLKEAFKDWLPPGFMDRGKMGFSAPMPGWLRHELAPMMRERLLDEKRLAPWINQSVVERLVREHIAGEKAHSKRLWPLLVMAEWVEQYGVTE
jgi:asparagine synthase (glutamine-hydrolysing)